jgi:hypothetical protein
MPEPTEEELEIGTIMWNLYELIYGHILNLEIEPLMNNDVFEPTRATVSKERAEAVLCAMGNVAASLMFRDHGMQEWFKENMTKTCARLAEEAKARAQ